MPKGKEKKKSSKNITGLVLSPKSKRKKDMKNKEKDSKKQKEKKKSSPHEDPVPEIQEVVSKPKKKREKTNLIDELCDTSSDNGRVGKDNFDLLAVIGRGSFGKVMQVREKSTRNVYAMKVMRKEAIIAKNQVAHTNDEKNILQKIKHPFIVNLNYAFQTDDKLYLILDYINGGELFFHLRKEKRFPEERVKFYAAELCLALMHLHSNGIIYRDLKPENILLDHLGHIVITDFGLSKEVFDDTTDTFCGTPEYLAPEVLRGGGHTFPVDWWSLGTLIYEMIVGLPPFYSKSITSMYNKIIEGELRFPQGVSESGMHLIMGLLDRDPEERFSGKDLLDHPWFEGINWEKMEAKEVSPLYRPSVRDAFDTSHIDPHFTSQKPVDSIVNGPSWLDDLSDDDRDFFEGFTFACDDCILNQSEE